MIAYLVHGWKVDADAFKDLFTNPELHDNGLGVVVSKDGKNGFVGCVISMASCDREAQVGDIGLYAALTGANMAGFKVPEESGVIADALKAGLDAMANAAPPSLWTIVA